MKVLWKMFDFITIIFLIATNNMPLVRSHSRERKPLKHTHPLQLVTKRFGQYSPGNLAN